MNLFGFICLVFGFFALFYINEAAPNVMETRGCIDRISTCELILKNNLCNYQPYYIRYCCESCSEEISEFDAA